MEKNLFLLMAFLVVGISCLKSLSLESREAIENSINNAIDRSGRVDWEKVKLAVRVPGSNSRIVGSIAFHMWSKQDRDKAHLAGYKKVWERYLQK